MRFLTEDCNGRDPSDCPTPCFKFLMHRTQAQSHQRLQHQAPARRPYHDCVKARGIYPNSGSRPADSQWQDCYLSGSAAGAGAVSRRRRGLGTGLAWGWRLAAGTAGFTSGACGAYPLFAGRAGTAMH